MSLFKCIFSYMVDRKVWPKPYYLIPIAWNPIFKLIKKAALTLKKPSRNKHYYLGRNLTKSTEMLNLIKCRYQFGMSLFANLYNLTIFQRPHLYYIKMVPTYVEPGKNFISSPNISLKFRLILNKIIKWHNEND